MYFNQSLFSLPYDGINVQSKRASCDGKTERTSWWYLIRSKLKFCLKFPVWTVMAILWVALSHMKTIQWVLERSLPHTRHETGCKWEIEIPTKYFLQDSLFYTSSKKQFRPTHSKFIKKTDFHVLLPLNFFRGLANSYLVIKRS